MKSLKNILFGILGVLAVGLLANTVLSIQDTKASRNPGDWINQTFWDGNPSDGNIIYALYGDGNPGSTPYNQNWTGGCLPTNVVHASTIPATISANTIYVINSGSYTSTSSITMAECSAIVGKGDISIATGVSISSTRYVILNNLKLVGNNANDGIYIHQANNNSINNVEIMNFNNGINLDLSKYNHINNTISHDNTDNGIKLNGASHNFVEYSQMYGNTDGMRILGTNGTTSNTGIDSSYNMINNCMFYQNSQNGLLMEAGDGSDGSNGDDATSNKYGNDGNSGVGGGNIISNTIQNSLFYNNNIGINLSAGNGGNGGDGGDASINYRGGDGGSGGNGGNIQNNILHNSSSYNNNNGLSIVGNSGGDGGNGGAGDGGGNGGDGGIGSNGINGSPGVTGTDLGLDMPGDGGDGGAGGLTINTIKNSYIYNNTTGILLNSTGNVGEGYITLFDNAGGNTGGTQNLGGTFNRNLNTETIGYNWLVNPRNASGDKLFNGLNYPSMIGQLNWTGNQAVKYLYGKNIIKQIQPEIYSGTTLVNYGVAGLNFDTSKYIAERELNMPSADEALVDYYYGANSQFTVNWEANNCSLGAFTVEHINTLAEFTTKLVNNNLAGHTIYVLKDGLSYTTSNEINITDNCTAIVAEGTGSIIYANTSNITAVISIEQKENIILDKLMINGLGRSTYGVELASATTDKSKNNTLNKIQSYNHKKNGILLGIGAMYNTIMDSQVWNNGENGIELYYTCNYNIINNSLSYNNNLYGIRFGNGSKYNTINNSQFFNNNVGGIFADYTTQQNIINNVDTYNNIQYGLNLKRSSGNTLNNIAAYNNDIGINVTDTSCVNNIYNGSLTLFDNISDNFSGTDGNDGFLISAAPVVGAWALGNIITNTGTMECKWATNPRYTDNQSNKIRVLSSAIGCANTGKQSILGSSVDGDDIEYMFGKSISKQIAPVGYNSGSIVGLSNQFDSIKYIGETNFIKWTTPAYINISLSNGSMQQLETDTEYTLDVDYGDEKMNSDFDVNLSFTPSSTTGYLKINTGAGWVNVGSGISNTSIDSTQIQIVLTSPSNYNETISGTIYIGTNQYGDKSKDFEIKTKPNPTPPTINWIKNVELNGISVSNSTWQAEMTGISSHSISGWFDYVTGSNECNSGIATNNNIYTGGINTIDTTMLHNLENKYVCIYVEDITNGKSTTSISNKIKIISDMPTISWVKNISTSGVTNADNTWQANIDGAYYISGWFDYVTGADECNSGISNNGYVYTGSISTIDTTTLHNLENKYICIYVKDTINNNSKTKLSNQIKIVDTIPTITWTDNINIDRLWMGSSDTWQAITSGAYDLNSRMKYVAGADECNSGIKINGTIYNGAIQNIVADAQYNTLNDKYICVYTQDTVNGKDSFTLSNKIRVSKLDFADDVEVGPVYYDVIDINFQNLTNYGYRRVNTGSDCNATSMSGLIFYNYNSPIILNSDLTFNGKYICAYGEDNTNVGHYIVSNNDVNISDYSQTVNFIDNVENDRVLQDTISVFFSGGVSFDHKKFKWVNYVSDCNNNNNMIDYTGSITITDESLNGKYFCLYSREHTSGVENYLPSINPLKIDITPPTIPVIDTPTIGEDITFLVVKTSLAIDDKSGIGGFEYQIAENETFLDVVSDGIYDTTGDSIIPDFDENKGTYTIKIKAIDLLGNKSARSNPINFDYQDLPNFRFDTKDNAKPGELYTSDKIKIKGLNTNETILASITHGILYRNDIAKGTSTLVQNDDTIAIEMFSSENFDDTTTSELTIANRHISWDINTYDEDGIDCDLSNTKKLGVVSIFNSILGTYSDEDTLNSFLITMQSMLEDNIDLADIDDNTCSLTYLLDMIDDELDTNNNASNTHTAPNCKEYSIDYSESKESWYSSNMQKRIYFGSRDDLGKYLDSKNPGDCHINMYGNITIYDNTDPDVHIAPNGKVYDIDNNDIGYTSPDFFVPKFFASLGELRYYIDINNPAIVVWDHDVDAEFEPVTHTAPNGKTYKIYKTSRGYMSYKFLNVKYFESLEELTNYIDKYNK